MNKWQTIHEYSYIVSVVVLCTFIHADRVLVDDLKKVAVNVLLVNDCNVLCCPVITLENLHIIFLNLACLFYNSVFLTCNAGVEKSFPFRICELVRIQSFKL